MASFLLEHGYTAGQVLALTDRELVATYDVVGKLVAGGRWTVRKAPRRA